MTVFSARSRQRAKVLLERYPDRRSAVMPLLYMAAQDDGYVTDEAMQEVAELTGLTSAQVHIPPCALKCQLRAPLLSPQVTNKHRLADTSPSTSRSASSFCCFFSDRRNISSCQGRVGDCIVISPHTH